MTTALTLTPGRWVLTGILAVGLPLAGCSSSRSNPPVARHTLVAITPAVASAAAAAINLTAADVPGFTSSPPSPKTTKDRLASTALAACYGGVDPATNVADLHSDDFSRGGGLALQRIATSVSFVRTLAEAHQDLAAASGPSASGCLRNYLDQAVTAGAGTTITLVSSAISALPTKAPGTDGAFGYRLTVHATSSGLSFAFYLDLLACLKGRTEVSLMTLGINSPFPPADRDRLWQAVVSRAASKAV